MKVPTTKIVTDENHRPIAVQVDYADWLEIERMLSANGATPPGESNLARWRGALALNEDPLSYQKRMRGEWA